MHIPVRPARSNEYDEVIDLVNRTFPPGDSAGIITTATVREDPRFRPDHLRVVERGGRIVGAVNLIDRFVHVGVARVRCAIVAPLVTAEAHQGTGVGSALMRNSLEWARGQGFHLSMLWGHPWLYPRYGYAPGIKSYLVTLPTVAPLLGDAAYTLRPYAAADAPELLQVYHAETTDAMLAEVRSDEPWEWRPHHPNTFVEVAVDPAKAIRGYMRVTRSLQRLDVGEIYAMDVGSAQALFDRLLNIGREQEATEIRITATPENRWTRLAFTRGAMVSVASGGGAGMVRILDLPSVLQATQPELERRIIRSEFAAKRVDIRIETPVGRTTIVANQGRIEIGDGRSSNVVTLPFHALGPLMSGYQSIADLRGLPGVFVHGMETERVLDVLFPEGHPHWSFAAYFG